MKNDYDSRKAIISLSAEEILAISGGGDGEDLAVVATGLAGASAAAASSVVLAPAAPVLLAAAATTLMLAGVAKIFETD